MRVLAVGLLLITHGCSSEDRTPEDATRLVAAVGRSDGTPVPATVTTDEEDGAQ